MVYADELAEYCRRTGKGAHEELRKVTTDPNMQMMIKMLMKEQDEAAKPPSDTNPKPS